MDPQPLQAALHVPVLEREVLSFVPRDAKRIVDATLGLGGHSEALLRSHPGARLLAFDRDERALELACERLQPFGDRVEAVHGDFRDGVLRIPEGRIDFALADLGVSSMQLDDASRGFSFRFDAPLDMRMDRGSGRTASDILNTASERELERILHEYGEEPKARAIARSVVMERRQRRVWTTLSFAALVRRDARGRPGLDPCTRAFQALRIATNGELEGLDSGLSNLARTLAPGGRLAVISFHSLEDRTVKTTFRSLARAEASDFELLTPKPIVPSDEETRTNPRARSAKLRVLGRETGGAR